MQATQCGQAQCNETDVSLSELSLSDLANMHLASSSSPAAIKLDAVVKGGGMEDNDTSTDALKLSLADLANLHASSLEMKEELNVLPSHSSSNFSLSELTNTQMSPPSTDDGRLAYDDTGGSSINLPLPDMNTQPAGLDFTSGFTTPRTGTMLSLSQLASLGSSTPASSNKSSKLTTPRPRNSSGGLAALATAYLNSSDNDNITSLVDLSTVKPPPGLAPSRDLAPPEVISCEDTPLSDVVKKLKIEDSCVSRANASLFATIICMRERDKPKRLAERHKHLKRKSWRTLINPHSKHIPFFTFTTPSPDDYVLQKQRQVFNS